MQLSELKTDCLFMSNATLIQYPDADLLRNLNIAYDDVVLSIWRVVADWQFDDSATTLPIATAALVAGQDNYALPTEARQIERIEVKDQAGNYIRLQSIDQANIQGSLEQFKGEDGVPRFYDLVGRTIMLYPASSYAADEGLLVMMSRAVTPLVNATDEPAVDRELHPLITLKAALRWCIAKGKSSKRNELEREIVRLEDKLKSLYSSRNKDYDVKIKPLRQDYN